MTTIPETLNVGDYSRGPATSKAPQHTPGPWIVGEECSDTCACAIEIIAPNDDGGDLVCEVRHFDGYPAGEHGAANARLIAAAPSLLENAQWVCKLFGTDNPQGIEELKSYVHALRCAVQQATE